MRPLHALLLGFTAFAATTCAKSDSTGPTGGNNNNNTAPRNGQLVVWTDQPVFLPMTVMIDGVAAGQITRAYPVPPLCNSAGVVVVTRPPGSVAVAASSPASSAGWSGTTDVSSDACRSLRLYSSSPPTPATTGRISIWKNAPAAGGVTVQVNGVEQPVLNTSFSSAPACGAEGTLTVTVGAGATMVVAKWNGYSWVATPEVPVNGCVRYGLAMPGSSGGGGGTDPGQPGGGGGGGAGGLGGGGGPGQATGSDSPDLVYIRQSWSGAEGAASSGTSKTAGQMRHEYCPASTLLFRNQVRPNSNGAVQFSLATQCATPFVAYICHASGALTARVQDVPQCAADPFDTPAATINAGRFTLGGGNALLLSSQPGITVQVFYCAYGAVYNPPANGFKGYCK